MTTNDAKKQIDGHTATLQAMQGDASGTEEEKELMQVPSRCTRIKLTDKRMNDQLIESSLVTVNHFTDT